jgi:hypothetical protein
MVIVDKRTLLFEREIMGRLDQIKKCFDYLEEMANKNEYEFTELKNELYERLGEIDAGISAIEEQIEIGVIKEAETTGYVRGIEHAQKIIDKPFKK